MTLESGDGVALTQALVRCDSRNPSLFPGAPGEHRVAEVLRDTLTSWGIACSLRQVAPGRPNVVATIPGSGGGRSLMFNGHLDTVDVAGMSHAPFDGTLSDGRIYGRGASDMKGGVAAMCAAAARLRGRLKGNLLIAAVMDEEWESHGTRALLREGHRTDAAIVTEPTRLRVMPAHKGFVWLEVEIHGRASHGSRWDIGVDAIRGAGLVLTELDRMDRDELPARRHALLGRPSLHASLIDGGVGMSTYPERCLVKVERRTLPGETNADVIAQFEQCAARVRAARPEFAIAVRMTFAQPPSDVAPDSPIVETLASCVAEHGLDAGMEGMSAWTDAALLNEAGIPAICFGPGDMGLAHADEEYIHADEIERATEILVAAAERWCN